MELEKPKKTKKRSREKKIKWWSLNNEEFELKFLTQVGETIENNWDRSTYEVVEEIRNQLTKMKGNKACGPDMIPIEVWKKMGEEGIVFLKKELNEILTSGIPSSWRLSKVTPLFKGKGSILECSNYRGIKLISHTLKLLERILDQRIITIVELGNIQFGFRRGRSTMDPVFALKILQEKYKEKQKDLHMIFS